jgi:hypothetical protein
VRFPAAVLAGAVAVVSGASSAYADPTAPELQAQGEELAKDGRFSEAIDAFKAADNLQPSAAHACLIALAYTRRELWPQAEIWLAQCQVRATAQDPLPDWAPAEKDQIDQRLATANVAAVQIEVQPADAGAKVTVSSFAPDEQFSPRTIHLPPGIHQIIVTAPGYQDGHQLLDIKDKTPQHIVIKLERPGEQKVLPPPTLPPAVSAAPPDRTPYYVLGAGGALAVTGVALHLFYYKPIHDKLAGDSAGDYPKDSGDFDRAREITIGVYIGAAVVLGIGTYLKVSQKTTESTTVGIVPTNGGGMVSLGWSR